MRVSYEDSNFGGVCVKRCYKERVARAFYATKIPVAVYAY